jgi:hypothetical protein
MSERKVRYCDECGAPRTTVNHWWCIVGPTVHPMFLSFEDTERFELEGRFTGGQSRLDYCSHKCVGTAFHRWLDTGDVLIAEKSQAVEASNELGARHGGVE